MLRKLASCRPQDKLWAHAALATRLTFKLCSDHLKHGLHRGLSSHVPSRQLLSSYCTIAGPIFYFPFALRAIFSGVLAGRSRNIDVFCPRAEATSEEITVWYHTVSLLELCRKYSLRKLIGDPLQTSCLGKIKSMLYPTSFPLKRLLRVS